MELIRFQYEVPANSKPWAFYKEGVVPVEAEGIQKMYASLYTRLERRPNALVPKLLKV